MLMTLLLGMYAGEWKIKRFPKRDKIAVKLNLKIFQHFYFETFHSISFFFSRSIQIFPYEFSIPPQAAKPSRATHKWSTAYLVCDVWIVWFLLQTLTPECQIPHLLENIPNGYGKSFQKHLERFHFITSGTQLFVNEYVSHRMWLLFTASAISFELL